MAIDRRFSTFHITRPSGIFPGLDESFVECDGVCLPNEVRRFCLLLRNLEIFKANMRIRVRLDHASGLCQLLGHRLVAIGDFSSKNRDFPIYRFGDQTGS